MSLRFGVCTTPENCGILASHGYDFIELPGAAMMALSSAEAEAAAKSLCLPAVGFNAISSGVPAFVGPDFDPDAVDAYVNALAARGALFGIRNLGFGAPKARLLPDGYPKDKADEEMAFSLRAAAAAAAKYGQRVLYEALHPGIAQYGCSTAEACRLVERLSLSNVGLVLDFYQMKLIGEDCTDIGRYIPLTWHLHISHYGAMRGFLVEEGREFYASSINAALRMGYSGTMSIESPSVNLDDDCGRSMAILKDITE